MNTRPLHLHYPPEGDPDTAPAAAFSAQPAPPVSSPDAPVPPLDVSVPLWYAAMRWMITKGLLLALLLGSLALAVYAVFIDRDHSSANDSPSASSSINGTIEARSGASANGIDYGTAPAGTHAAPGSTGSAGSATPPAVSVTPIVPVAHPGDIAGDLQTARTALQAANLSAAKGALDDIFATQPDNADARALQQQLVQRQQHRDASMQVAIACAKDQVWSCVRTNAQDALAADSSSRIAQALLEQAILASGWATKPAANGAANSAANGATNGAANGAASQQPAAPVTQAAPDLTNVEAAERSIEASGWRNPPLPPTPAAMLTGDATKSH